MSTNPPSTEPSAGKPSTRDRLVETAVELFQERGYESTSLAVICERAEVNPGSLYYFFPAKEDLLDAVLEWYERHLHPNLLEPLLARYEDPIERIFALLDLYRQSLEATDCAYGCPIGSLALEIKVPPERIRGGLQRNFAGWVEAVESWLREASDRLPQDVVPGDLATFVLTTMEGGVMQARTSRDLEPFDASVRQLRRYFRLLAQRADAGPA